MIRHAETEDFYDVLDCLVQFAEESRYSEEYEVDVQSIANTLGVVKSTGCVLVWEEAGEIVGVLAGVLAPLPFNHSIYAASEMAWWVKPEYRSKKGSIQLLNTFEDWAVDSGATLIHMTSLESLEPIKIGNIYEKKGYVVKEHAYAKVL